LLSVVSPEGPYFSSHLEDVNDAYEDFLRGDYIRGIIVS